MLYQYFNINDLYLEHPSHLNLSVYISTGIKLEKTRGAIKSILDGLNQLIRGKTGRFTHQIHSSHVGTNLSTLGKFAAAPLIASKAGRHQRQLAVRNRHPAMSGTELWLHVSERILSTHKFVYTIRLMRLCQILQEQLWIIEVYTLECAPSIKTRLAQGLSHLKGFLDCPMAARSQIFTAFRHMSHC